MCETVGMNALYKTTDWLTLDKYFTNNISFFKDCDGHTTVYGNECILKVSRGG